MISYISCITNVANISEYPGHAGRTDAERIEERICHCVFFGGMGSQKSRKEEK